MSISMKQSTKQHLITKFHLNMVIAGNEQDLSDEVISAKMTVEKPFFPDAVPISTLEVVIGDPDGIYSIIRAGGSVEIADVDQLAVAYVEAVPQYFVQDKTGTGEWVIGEPQKIDLGEWYFNKSSYKDNKLTMQFYDSIGIEDKTVVSDKSHPIFFYDYQGTANTMEDVQGSVESGIAYPLGMTEREYRKSKLLPYPDTSVKTGRGMTTVQNQPLTMEPSIELSQKTTAVTLQSRCFRAQYSQNDIKTLKIADRDRSGLYFENTTSPSNGKEYYDAGYWEETIAMSSKNFDLYANLYEENGYCIYSALVRLNGNYLPYTYIAEGWSGDEKATSFYVSNYGRGTNWVVLYFTESVVPTGQCYTTFDTIKIKAVPVDVLASGVYHPGTYTIDVEDFLINTSVEALNTGMYVDTEITFDKMTSHHITFTVVKGGEICICQQKLIEEKTEATAAVADMTGLAEKKKTLNNPYLLYGGSSHYMQQYADKCLELLNQYPYSISVKVHPQIIDESTYETSLGTFEPNITEREANFCYSPDWNIVGHVGFYYRPAADPNNRNFFVYAEKVEIDLAAGCIQNITGVARPIG